MAVTNALNELFSILWQRTQIGPGFFDTSINREAAWAIGTRNTLKAVLAALLEPTEKLQQLEKK